MKTWGLSVVSLVHECGEDLSSWAQYTHLEDPAVLELSNKKEKKINVIVSQNAIIVNVPFMFETFFEFAKQFFIVIRVILLKVNLEPLDIAKFHMLNKI